MPQTVQGEGYVLLKPGRRGAIAELVKQFEGWLQWDRFELTADHFSYSYDDVVTIGTAGDLDDFLEQIACDCAAAGWPHFDDDVTFYAPNEQARLAVEIEFRRAVAETALRDLEAALSRVAAP